MIAVRDLNIEYITYQIIYLWLFRCVLFLHVYLLLYMGIILTCIFHRYSYQTLSVYCLGVFVFLPDKHWNHVLLVPYGWPAQYKNTLLESCVTMCLCYYVTPDLLTAAQKTFIYCVYLFTDAMFTSEIPTASMREMTVILFNFCDGWLLSELISTRVWLTK